MELHKLALAVLGGLLVALALQGCGEKTAPAPSSASSGASESRAGSGASGAPDSGAARRDRRGSESDEPVVTEGPPGRIVGATIFEGTPPARRELAIGSTVGCEHASPPLSEAVLVEDGRLLNVFVYITKGVDAAQVPPAPSEPHVIEQTGCIYRPRMSGARAGQPVHVRNGDGVAHNVHVKSTRNGEPNSAQPAGSAAIELAFERPEVPVKLVCDYHPWMVAYIGVVEHPYFAVSTAAGFEIDGVPPGRYTLTAWHEDPKIKMQREEIVVPPGGEVEVDFTFSR